MKKLFTFFLFSFCSSTLFSQMKAIDSLLFVAIKAGNQKEVSKLITDGAYVDCVNRDGTTPLMYAAAHNEFEISKILINNKANVHKNAVINHYRNVYYYSVLNVAIANNNFKLLKYLIEECKVDVNKPEINLEGQALQTPLQVNLNNEPSYIDSIFNYLIAKGVDVNLSFVGKKPLDIAISKQAFSKAKTLLINGANLTDYFKYWKPIHIACAKGDTSALETLLKNSKNWNIKNNLGETPIVIAIKWQNITLASELINLGVNLQLADKKGITPLMLACNKSHKLVDKIISKGVNVNVKNKYGETAILYAYPDSAIYSSLIKAGANINIIDKAGNTPICNAAFWNDMAVVEMLLNSGAIVNNPKFKSQHPIIAAVENENVTMVERLINAGAMVNVKTLADRTALYSAIETTNIDLIKLLIKAGADVNVANYDYIINTPLLLACEINRLDIVELLLKAGANVNFREKNGEYPLVIAIKNNELDLVKMLINAGANIDVQGNEDESILHILYMNCSNNKEMARLLLNAGLIISPLKMKYIESDVLPMLSNLLDLEDTISKEQQYGLIECVNKGFERTSDDSQYGLLIQSGLIKNPQALAYAYYSNAMACIKLNEQYHDISKSQEILNLFQKAIDTCPVCKESYEKSRNDYKIKLEKTN